MSVDASQAPASFKVKVGQREITLAGKRAATRFEAFQRVAEFLKDYRRPEDPQTGVPRKLWVYWAQGFESAPPIVSRCLYSIRKRNQNIEIIELTDKNIGDYVSIPNAVSNKLKDNKTHFSDLLRCHLLAEHGGAWADATCLCAKSVSTLMQDMQGTRYFAYTVSRFMSSWFMISSAHSTIPVMLRDFMTWYWTNYNKLPDYYWLHLSFEALYEHDTEFKRMWDSRITRKSSDAHQLQWLLPKSFDPEAFKQTLQLSHIHKLTYKLKPVPGPNTYWSHLNDMSKAF